MSISILKVLPDIFDIKRHSPSIFYILTSLMMSTSVLKVLPGKLDINRHSPSIFYILLFAGEIIGPMMFITKSIVKLV